MIDQSPTVSPPRQAATRQALLDAAEGMLAKHGVAGTSTRDIIKAAGANLGAINYYFGSKEALVLEVFARRLRSLHGQMIARLDGVEAAARPGQPKLEQIIEAMVGPIVEIHESQPDQASLLRLICLEFREANPTTRAFVEAEYAEVAKRFDAAILGSVPGLPPGEFLWRMKFVCGALHCGIDMWTGFENAPRFNPDIQPRRLDREGFLRRFVTFVSAGLSAPIPKDE
jgi:AcrR family transcriptional regulator